MQLKNFPNDLFRPASPVQLGKLMFLWNSNELLHQLVYIFTVHIWLHTVADFSF